MIASFLDLRKHSKEILQALDRNEPVTLFYRGKPKAIITPIEGKSGVRADEMAAFGLWADNAELADPTEYVRDLRKRRRHDL